MSDAAIIGIDLGTSNSCVAVQMGKRQEIIRNSVGDRTTPSVVTFREDGAPVVGAPALRQAIMNPEQTISEVKRLVGRRFDSPEVSELRTLMPYDMVRAPNGDAWVRIHAQERSPSEIQAYVLEELRDSAEDFLVQRIERAIITVPAHFDEAQRQATRDAAAIAGLEPVRILGEPTAAALAYGFARAKSQRIVVVDLGGGTFDVTVMHVDDGRFEVLATDGDMLLGGADFDRVLAVRFAEEIARDFDVDVLDNAVALQRLVGEAESAKKTLTNLESVEIHLPYLATGPKGPVDYKRVLTRAELRTLVAPLVDRLQHPCLAALETAGLTPDAVDDVILIGGMTRSPLVQEVITELFGRTPSVRINPDEAVAMGAALLTGSLFGSLPHAELVDVAPRTVGLRVAGDRMAPLVAKSTKLPVTVTKGFATTTDNQPNFELQVYQGEDPVASNNRRLSTIQIEGLPPAPKGGVRLAVSFHVDTDGLLSVTSRIVGSDQQIQTNITAASGLGRAEVARLAEERAQHRPPPPKPASARTSSAPAATEGFGIQFSSPAPAPARAGSGLEIKVSSTDVAASGSKPLYEAPAAAKTSATASAGADADGTSAADAGARFPLWLIAAAAIAVVGGVVAAVLFLGG